MAKKKKQEVMTEQDLLNEIRLELANTQGPSLLSQDGDELDSQRSLAMKYYYANELGTEIPDRSQVTTSDVMDVIEWMMPSLMRIFGSSESPIKFEPSGAEDVQAANLETKGTNYVFMVDNPGYKNMLDFIKDGLLLKTGIFKTYWDETECREREDYTGLTRIQLMQILSRVKDDIQDILTFDNYPDNSGMGDLYDISFILSKPKNKVTVEVIAPEDFFISKGCTNPNDARICGEIKRTTFGDLVKAGYDISNIKGTGSEWITSAVKIERDIVDSGDTDHNPLSQGSTYAKRKLTDEIDIIEAYIKIDYDNDGYVETRRIVFAGDTIFENDEIDMNPYSVWTPIPIPHKFFGLSIADQTMDIQLIKTTILRNILDNIYLINNGRYTVVKGEVELDDLLTSRPFGIVRQNRPEMIKRLDQPDLPKSSFEMLGYLDETRDARTGIRKFNTGLDPSSLQNTNQAAISQYTQSAQQRLELISRHCLELGIKDCYWKIHELLTRHQGETRRVWFNEEWVDIDPSNWKTRTSMTVMASLAAVDKEQHLRNFGMLASMMQQVGQTAAGFMIQPKNVYNLFISTCKALNIKNASDYITPPEQARQQQQRDLKGEAAMLKAQVAAEKLKLEMERLKLEKAELQAKIKMEEQKNQLKLIELGIESQQKRPVKAG